MKKTTPASVQQAMNTAAALWAPVNDVEEGTSREQIEAQRHDLKSALHRLDTIVMSCNFCRQFDIGDCKKHGAIPPEYQKPANDCADWEYSGIPF